MERSSAPTVLEGRGQDEGRGDEAKDATLPTGPTPPTVASGTTRPFARNPPTATDAATLDLPKPETVLGRAEIEQTRRTAITGLLFNALGLLAAPVLEGDRTAWTLFVVALILAFLNNAWLFWIASSERRYARRWIFVYFALAPFMNAAVIYYLGVFGPILMMFVLNLYTACLGYDRRVALLVLAGSIVPVLVLGDLMTAGIIADPGQLTVAAHMGAGARACVLVAFIVFLCLVYVQARKARELIVASLGERDEAVRNASHRDALFLEARQDLERALQAGGLGRFTDQTLGSYRLGAVIGRGGMGEVYEAAHVETGEPAALKMLLPEVLGRPDYVRRFLREVRIAASLDSPHVVRVLEVGDESAPLPYLAMERLQGEDLAQILRREGRLEPRAVVDMARQIGSGLRTAAEAGIVHRDLKPQNVFRTGGDMALWKILDFGVSKLVEASSTLTRGEAIGTPQYMAPEQAKSGDVGPRTDLYALGALVYRALTGHQPFKGDESAGVLLAVMNEMPVRPTSLVHVPHDVDLALAIALAKAPADRYADAAELVAALDAALASRLGAAHRKRAASLLAALPWSEPD